MFYGDISRLVSVLGAGFIPMNQLCAEPSFVNAGHFLLDKIVLLDLFPCEKMIMHAFISSHGADNLKPF